MLSNGTNIMRIGCVEEIIFKLLLKKNNMKKKWSLEPRSQLEEFTRAVNKQRVSRPIESIVYFSTLGLNNSIEEMKFHLVEFVHYSLFNFGEHAK